MMDDLKFKLLGLINKQNQSKIPSMGLNPELLNPIDEHENGKQSNEATSTADSEAISDQDILETIEQVYFKSDDTFDPCRYELNKLSSNPTCDEIEKSYKKLKRQQQVVSNKVLQFILQKQNLCNEEFKEILNIQQQLTETLEICRVSRLNLGLAKTQFTTASLGILANYRKRQIVQELLYSLNTIKTLQRTEDRLQELLKEENFPGAISLLLECQSAAQTYKHFNCVAVLAGKLQDTLEQTEETLDNTVSRLCTNFDSKTYSSVQEAYKLLKKTQTAIDQLHMHFTAAIHNTAFTIVYSQTGGDVKRQYKQLCQSVPHDCFINCLIDLCKGLWRIICSYHQVLIWHSEHRTTQDTNEPEETFNNHYITQKLETGMSRIWHDVEIKLSTYLNVINLEKIRFEQFVQILAIVNRLMEIGNELCSSKSDNLQNFMKNNSFNYFSYHHALRLEELLIFLEHEGWELCPVKANFVATKLQEFKSLRPTLLEEDEDELSSKNVQTSSWVKRYMDADDCPFDIGLNETVDESILGRFNDDGSGDFTEDSDDENNYLTIKKKFTGPIMTNTSLSILRFCGKYLQMSRLLRSITKTVIQSIIQFFEFYFYSVHKFFTSDLQISSESLYTPKLKLTLARIKDNLIFNDCVVGDEGKEVGKRGKIRQPVLSESVDISDGDKLFGLAERIVGVESIVELGQQYKNLGDCLKHLKDNQLDVDDDDDGRDGDELLNQFHGQTIAAAVDLRKPVYMAVVEKCIDVSKIIGLMGKVDWEVRDVMSQHSDYVDAILRDIEEIKKRFERIGDLTGSEEVRAAWWENVAHLINHTLVEGYSNAKKCSNGGRGLMQLDFTQLKTKFEMITSVRPMPRSEYVEMYIKAYYIAEPSLEEWLEKHKEYSVKHKSGLISCACQNNKKYRQRLLSIIEEQRTNR